MTLTVQRKPDHLKSCGSGPVMQCVYTEHLGLESIGHTFFLIFAWLLCFVHRRLSSILYCEGQGCLPQYKMYGKTMIFKIPYLTIYVCIQSVLNFKGLL